MTKSSLYLPQKSSAILGHLLKSSEFFGKIILFRNVMWPCRIFTNLQKVVRHLWKISKTVVNSVSIYNAVNKIIHGCLYIGI